MTDDDLYWNPEFFGTPADRIWALREASKPSGFCPHAQGTGELLRGLANRELVHESECGHFFGITKEGRAELARLEASVIEQLNDGSK